MKAKTKPTDPPATAREEQLVTLAAEFIHISEHNTRQPTIKEVTAAGLVDSMRQQGQITPGIGRPHPKLGKGHIELAAGARRSVSAAHLGIPYKVIVRDMTDNELLDVILTENLQREDPDPEQEAELIELRLSEGQTPEEICARYGKSDSWVKRRMKLIQIIPDLRKDMRPGKPLEHFTTGMKERIGALSLDDQKNLVKEKRLQYARDLEALLNTIHRGSHSLEDATWLTDPVTFIPGCGPGCATNTATSLFPEDGEKCGSCLNGDCFNKRKALAIDAAITTELGLHKLKITDCVLFRTNGYQQVAFEGKNLKITDPWNFKREYSIVKKDGDAKGLNLEDPLQPKVVHLKKTSAKSTAKGTSNTPTLTREEKLTAKRLSVMNERLVEALEEAPVPETMPMLNIVAALGMTKSNQGLYDDDDHKSVWDSMRSKGKVPGIGYGGDEGTREEVIWQAVKPILVTRLAVGTQTATLQPFKRKEMEETAKLIGFPWDKTWQGVCTSEVPVPKSWGPGFDPVTLKLTTASKPAAAAKPAKKIAKKATKKGKAA